MNQCFAYELLKKQIGKQCKIYKRLRKNEDLGSMEGMYKKDDKLDTYVPTDDTSAFLRGGIITTMACFEGFVYNLMDEAKKTLQVPRNCKPPCDKCKQLQLDHVFGDRTLPELTTQENPKLVYHDWNKKYSDLLDEPFLHHLFADGHINFYYPLDGAKISHLEIKDKEIICAFVRLFHGIRCIMAHGGHSSTLTNPATLRHFPLCSACVKNEHHFDKNEKSDQHIKEYTTSPMSSTDDTSWILKNVKKLSDLLDECIEIEGRKEILKQSRHFPQPESFNALNAANKKTANDIITEYKLNIDEFSDETIVHEKYAYFHMCRVFHWLEENERDMYITYRMLVRINQFILVLAFRMQVAVAKILMNNPDPNNPIKDGDIFGVPKDGTERKKKIEEFEKEHKKTVESLSQEHQEIVEDHRTCTCTLF